MDQSVHPSPAELAAYVQGDLHAAAHDDLERHLTDCESCCDALRSISVGNWVGGLVEGPNESDGNVSTIARAGGGTADSDGPVTEPVPERIGRYRILGTIGDSGQATVYRGLHPTLEKEVAIKLCRRWDDATDRYNRQHVIDEGKILGQLDHPNIARVYDLDFYLDRPFLALHYVRGCNLRQYMQSKKLSATSLARMLAQLAAALHAAHELGVVHRDVKPDNILIDPDNHPWIIDFGVAQLRDAWSNDAGIDGEVTGTVGFIPPEQARGDADNVNARSDVFGLGAVLYWCLTGRPPFAGTTWRETWMKASRCDFDAQAVQRVGTPRQLQAICLKAMSAEPRDRYSTAIEMAGRLERFAGAPRRRIANAVGIVLLATLSFFIWRASSTARLPKNAPSGVSRSQSVDDVLELNIAVANVGAPQQSLRSARCIFGGQQVTIEWGLPEAYESSAFWFGTSGKLSPLLGRPTKTADPHRRRYVFPNRNESQTVDNSTGTELILVCARRGQKPTEEELKQLLEPQGPWPALPTIGGFEIVPDGVEWWHSRDLTNQTMRRVEVEIEERAENLRQGLVERYELFRVVAFPHYSSDQ